MSDYKRIFNKLAGVQNNVPEYRLFTQQYDPSETMVTIPLSDSRDMLIDDSGSAFRRPGYRNIDDAVWHSLFCDKTDAVGVRGQDLVLINGESYRTLATGITTRASYAQVLDEIFYVADFNQGRVSQGVRLPWPDMPTVPYDSDRFFVQHIPAKLIAFWQNRIWLARENFVVCSEPWAYGLFDLHQSTFPFGDEVTMLRPVAGGVYISTTKKVYFLTGSEPGKMEAKVAAESPALAWSDSQVLVPAKVMGLDPELGDVALWMAEDGAYMGLSNGVAVNMTETMVEFPAGNGHGACLPFGEHLFFCMDKQ